MPILLLAFSLLSLHAQERVAAAGEHTVRVRLPQLLLPLQPVEIDVSVSPPAPFEVAIDMPSMPGMPVIRGTSVRFPHGGLYRLRVLAAGNTVEFPVQVQNSLGLAGMGIDVPQAGLFASGTSQVPRASPMYMTMWNPGNWSLMLHGIGYAVQSNQTGPRGRDKFYAPNWLMAMASHRLGPGVLTLRSMITMEPLTITNRRYPLLFQTGETANGIPIINGQHPHDVFMELAALYQINLGERTAVHFYGGPRGDPAIGPPAFPHRMSASENPQAVISHHYQDSTHISSNVITAGLTHGPLTWEVSGFHGREPDEKRWGMEGGAIDSFATRLTVNPARRWSAQVSAARINNRETTHPIRDTLRTTASLIYARPLRQGHWMTTLVWGRNHDLAFTQRPELAPRLPLRFDVPRRPNHFVIVPTRIPGQIYNSYLAESTLRFRRNYWLWGRAENTDKDTTLLFEEAPVVLLVDEQRFARVQLYTAGAGRELPGYEPWLSPMLGLQWTLFHAPPNLAPVYGQFSHGIQAFLRVRLGTR